MLCCLSVIPKVLLAGAITLMDEAYYKLAVWLNDKGKLQSFRRVGQQSIMSLVDCLTANTFLIFSIIFLFYQQKIIVYNRNMKII